MWLESDSFRKRVGLWKNPVDCRSLVLQGSSLKPKSNIMAKKLQLQIPEPCHEDWNKMTPLDKGRFCDSCQKAVIDFTRMSDTQLIAFFKKPTTGSVCGRFHNDQLERDIAFPRKRIPWFKYMLQICLPFFVANAKAISQGKPAIKLSETAETCIKPDTNAKLIMVGQLAPPKLALSPIKNRLQGRVVDEEGNSIPHASVFIKDSKKGVNCDARGYFSIKVNPKEKFVTLVTSSIGYETNEKTISNNAGSINEIVLKSEPIVLKEVIVNSTVDIKRMESTGFVVITDEQHTLLGRAGAICVTYFEKDTILTTIKNFFIKDPFKVYPNPAKSGSAIKIEIRNTGSGEMQIELFNLQGQLIGSSVINTYEKNSTITYQLPNIIAGSYLLRLKNKKSGKIQTEKIIIQ